MFTSFSKALENGTITHRNGYHQPDNWNYNRRHCGCKNVTEKGAYRDMSIEIDGKTVHYYHQTPVAVEKDGKVYLNNGGYKTSTTKTRINRYSPHKVIQRDFEWYVVIDGEKHEFVNGMELEL